MEFGSEENAESVTEAAALRSQLEKLQAAYNGVLLEKNFLQRALSDLNFHNNACSTFRVKLPKA